MIRRLIVVCNALDDETRLERGISTDSPAASRKVFMMCNAIREAKVRPIVLSLGRGRQNGSGEYFPSVVRRVNRVTVIYLPFIHLPLLSQLLSFIGPVWFMLHFRRLQGAKTVLFYNRMPAYILALVTAAFLGFRTVLDLEDGEVKNKNAPLSNIVSSLMRRLFDGLCSGGALLACSALKSMTALRPVACYYGSINPAEAQIVNWSLPEIGILLGGTVSQDTGALLLVDAVKLLRLDRPSWCQKFTIEITGKGDAIEAFAVLAKEPGYPIVRLHGRTTDVQYRSIVSRCHVGLALKPNAGALANSTFPSKVIELAGAGLLVLTTNISDVQKVLFTGALYLKQGNPLALVEHLRWIVTNRDDAAVLARRGMLTVHEQCSPKAVASFLTKFFFESK